MNFFLILLSSSFINMNIKIARDCINKLELEENYTTEFTEFSD